MIKSIVQPNLYAYETPNGSIILFLASNVEQLFHLNNPFLNNFIHTLTLLMICRKMVLIYGFKLNIETIKYHYKSIS